MKLWSDLLLRGSDDIRAASNNPAFPKVSAAEFIEAMKPLCDYHGMSASEASEAAEALTEFGRLWRATIGQEAKP